MQRLRKNAYFLNCENVKHVFPNSVRKQKLYANALQFELTAKAIYSLFLSTYFQVGFSF